MTTSHPVPPLRFLLLLLTALLSPMVRIVPSTTAKAAGRAGWLTPLLMLPLALLLLWVIGRGLRRTSGGLIGLYRAAFGETGSRWVCGLSGLFLWVVLWGGLRFYGERFVSTMYPDVHVGVFLGCMAAVVLWIAPKPLSVLANAGRVFAVVAAVVITLVTVLSLNNIEVYHILPLWTGDLWTGLTAGLPLLGALSLAAAGGFLADEAALGRQRRTLLCGAGLLLLLTYISVVTIGVFGAETTAELQVPFFNLAKEAGIEGAVERLESVVACVWVFNDVLFLTLLAKGSARALSHALGVGERWLLVVIVIGAVAGGLLMAKDTLALERFFAQVIVWGQVGGLIVVPVAAAGKVSMRR